MAITKKSSRKQFAAEVVKQLEKHDISCVLVGGACVSIYTNEKHKSRDLDFISPHAQESIEKALKEIGFKRSGRYFVHARSEFYLEFPTGPVAIGTKVPVQPEGRLKVGKTVIKMLSPTQSVMDRLIAWMAWNDRRSLIHAIWISQRHPINLSKIRKWAHDEGESEKFEHFLEQLRQVRRSQTRRSN